MDEKTNITLYVTWIQYLRKYNDNSIDIIKSSKKKTKTLFWIFIKDQGDTKKKSEINCPQKKIIVVPPFILLSLFHACSTKQNWHCCRFHLYTILLTTILKVLTLISNQTANSICLTFFLIINLLLMIKATMEIIIVLLW